MGPQHATAQIDVFISYKREQRAVAQALSQALRAHGEVVWWDVDLLPGDRFAREIASVLDAQHGTGRCWAKASEGASCPTSN